MTPVALVESMGPGTISEAARQVVGRLRALKVSIQSEEKSAIHVAALRADRVRRWAAPMSRRGCSALGGQAELVYEAVRARRMPCLRVGRHIRFTRPMLERWLAENAER
jgi:excisionase family DNA binding protein